MTYYVSSGTLTLGVVRTVYRGIAVLDGNPRRPRGRRGFGGVLFSIFTMGNAIRSPTVKCFQFLCENLTTFPFGEHTARFAFW